METDIHEKYEYARARITQKKWLVYHFVFMLIGGLFLFIANHFLQLGGETQWYTWIITIWFFIFILHFIKVYITNRFMNKNWERTQIDRLIAKQEQKIQQLEANLNQQNQKN
jgi:phosphotransferase system  glucose/maltose/N-acetylglucosamine-specific IIC component